MPIIQTHAGQVTITEEVSNFEQFLLNAPAGPQIVVPYLSPVDIAILTPDIDFSTASPEAISTQVQMTHEGLEHLVAFGNQVDSWTMHILGYIDTHQLYGYIGAVTGQVIRTIRDYAPIIHMDPVKAQQLLDAYQKIHPYLLTLHKSERDIAAILADPKVNVDVLRKLTQAASSTERKTNHWNDQLAEVDIEDHNGWVTDLIQGGNPAPLPIFMERARSTDIQRRIIMLHLNDDGPTPVRRAANGTFNAHGTFALSYEDLMALIQRKADIELMVGPDRIDPSAVQEWITDAQRTTNKRKEQK